MQRPSTDGGAAHPGRRGIGAAWLTRQALWCLVGAMLLAVLGMTTVGLPAPWRRHLLARFNAQGLAMETGGIRLDLAGGVVLDGVALYRRGVAGPPLMAARRIRLRFDLPALVRGTDGWLRAAIVERGVIRMPSGGSADDRAALLDRLPPRDYRIELLRSEVYGIPVDRLSARIRARGRLIEVTRLEGRVGEGRSAGKIGGDLTMTPAGSVHGTLDTSFDPHLLDPLGHLLAGDDWTAFDPFTFVEKPPDCAWQFEHSPGNGLRLRVDLQASRFRYRGEAVAFASLTARLTRAPAAHTLRLDPLRIVTGEQTTRGTVELDWERRQVAFNVASDADPAVLGRLIGWDGGLAARAVRGGGQSHTTARGVVAWGNAAANKADVRIEGATLVVNGITAQGCSVTARIEGITNRVADVHGRLYGGSFSGSGWMTGATESGPGAFRAQLEVIHADVAALLRDATGHAIEPIQGRLYGTVDLGGHVLTNHVRIVDGSGSLRVKQGRLLNLPLFGQFTDSMRRIVPGMDWLTRTTEGRFAFDVRDGVLHTEDAALEGDAFSLVGRGDCRLADGTLEATVRVTPLRGGGILSGAMRALAFPVSKLLEFNVGGTLGNPVWTLRNLPGGEGGAGDDAHREPRAAAEGRA